MFCEKCGREVPEDSIYCAYCGIRFAEEIEVQKSATPIYSKPPKKTCGNCGKELPFCTPGDLCALCAMRKERADKDIYEASISQAAKAQRDRYDISDEFDWDALHMQKPTYDSVDKYGNMTSDSEEKKTKNKKLALALIVGIIVFSILFIPLLLNIAIIL